MPWKKYGLYDYPQIVKFPMDLGTMAKKMEAGEYLVPQDFCHDMRLIWTNCCLYNQDGSEYNEIAKKFQAMFEDKFSKIKGVEAAEPPNLKEKQVFSENMYKITGADLGKVVQRIDERCEAAIDKKSTDELEINIDAIDADTFRSVDALVKHCLANLKKTKRKKKPEDGGKAKKQKT